MLKYGHVCSADNNLGWLCQSPPWGPLRSRSLRTLLDFSDTFKHWLSLHVILLHVRVGQGFCTVDISNGTHVMIIIEIVLD